MTKEQMIESLKEIETAEKLLSRELSPSEQEYVTSKGLDAFLNDLGLTIEEVKILDKVKNAVSKYNSETGIKEPDPYATVKDLFYSLYPFLFEKPSHVDGRFDEEQLEKLEPDDVRGYENVSETDDQPFVKIFPKEFKPWLDYITPKETLEILNDCDQSCDGPDCEIIQKCMNQIKEIVSKRLCDTIIENGYGVIRNKLIYDYVYKVLAEMNLGKVIGTRNKIYLIK